MSIVLDKLITAKFICPTCGKSSHLKADKRGEFPTYMQCCHCEQYLVIFTQLMSLKINVNVLNKNEIEWLLSMEKKSKDSAKPLLIYRTKENGF